MNGGKAKQETVSGPKGMGEKTSGVEQTDEDKTENEKGKIARGIENRSAVVSTENERRQK